MAGAITIGLGTTGLASLAAGAGGLAALASGAALAGAIGLGIAGIAVVAKGKKYGGHGGYGGHGYGGYGGHGGYGSHGHGGGKGHGGYGYKKGYGHGWRKKRSADRRSEAIRNLLEVIRAEDVTGCGLKLVCELAGLQSEDLSEEEFAILNLVGPVVQPGEGLLPPGGASDYAAAKVYGQHHGDCAKALPMCPLNGTELMGAVMRFLP